MTRMFSSLFTPLALLSLALVLLHFSGKYPGTLPAAVHYIPYLVAVTGMALSWRFNRGQSFYVLAVLALSYWGLLFSLQESHVQSSLADNIYAAIGILVPANLVLFSLLGERGILKLQDWMRLSVMVLQLLLLGIMFSYDQQQLGKLLHFQFVSHPWLAVTPLPQPVLIMLLTTLVFLLTRLAIRRNAIDSGLLGALVTLGVLLHLRGDTLTTAILLTAAGLMIILAVIQHSYRMAFIDELTELPSRRALTDRLKSLGKHYVIAMLDIDHFKRVNDKYGHDTGDQVLRYIASKMKTIGANGKAYRYGGEEFTLVFAARRLDEVMPHLEVLRREIAESPFQLRGKSRPKKRPRKLFRGTGNSQLKVTVSIGVAERSAGSNTPALVIKAADKVLYRAKKNGRNCICFR